MFQIPGAGNLIAELRAELQAQRGCLNSILRQLGREYLLPDQEQAPGSAQDLPVLVQQTGGAGLGEIDLRARLPSNRYAHRGYIANQDTADLPMWLKIITPSGQATDPFMLSAGQSWPFPCNVAKVLVIADPSNPTAPTATTWQVMAQ